MRMKFEDRKSITPSKNSEYKEDREIWDKIKKKTMYLILKC